MASAIGEAKGVDLNRASEQQLDQVGGLGAVGARRLIERRPFRKLGRPETSRRLR
jgi:DNA uptake protein ComE-like DNA-binding protein